MNEAEFESAKKLRDQGTVFSQRALWEIIFWQEGIIRQLRAPNVIPMRLPVQPDNSPEAA